MSLRSRSSHLLIGSLFALFGIFLFAGQWSIALGAESGDELASSFVSPPDSARPHTWWHWMNGNVTKEGITADLEGMARVGVGGAQIFNVLEWIPDGPVPYLSPQSLDMFRHAAKEAERLGLELCFHNCAGWSSSGGPWIKPERAMQTVVSSETKVKGPKHFEAVLPQPKANLDYYRDIAVVAFPTPAKKVAIENLKAKALQPWEYQYGLQPAGKDVPAEAVVAKDKVVELTSYLGADGKLTWDVPEGNWTIVRIGHTPTGAVCAPAPVPGRGLECDKLSREGIDAHWAGGIDPLLKHLGPLAGKVLNNCLIDSYEVGTNNWTPKFRDEFSRRRGYDLGPFLPVLTGQYVGSGEMTERFLWDFRRTIGDLMAENYYNRFAELCKQHGLLYSVEPYDGPFECLQVGEKADIVMGEFWATTNLNAIGAVNTIKLAATVANTHGVSIVGAESFTGAPGPYSNWLGHPGMLKPEGDAMWCLGLNRFIFHTHVHQPWLDKWPGMTMGQWGTHFGRTNTWWELSKPWMKYIARSQYLLQKGHTVADVLYFGGEGSPNGGIFSPELKAKGYDYDVVGTDLVMKLTVKDGLIQTPAGGKYRILVLPDTEWMTPQLADKIGQLAKAGATILGSKPKKSPSLTNHPECDAEVAKSADGVWGKTPSEVADSRPSVLTGRKPEDVLAGMKVAPDFESQAKNAKLNFIHRVVGDTDIYFVANPNRAPRTVNCAFRIVGHQPELWDAQSGTIQPAPAWEVKDGRTIVPLSLEQAGSVFVVFRKPADAPSTPMISVDRQADEAAAPHKLTIKKAVYGDFSKPDGKKVDVTAKLAELAKDGDLDIAADNGLAGDPAYGIAKQLRVDYVLDGKAKSITVAENQPLQLPAEECIDTPPAPQLSLDNDQLVLTVAKNGRYLLTSSDQDGKAVSLPAMVVEDVPAPAEVTGSWEVLFQEGRGAPAKTTFDKLISWPDSKDKGIKYFSGTAVYRKTIDIPAERFGENRSILLDLGSVKEIAEVRLNGQDLGILWKAPFRVDVTKAAKAGENELEVRVTNLWANRLIGDEQYPDDCQWDGTHLKQWPEWMLKGQPRPVKERLTFTTWKHWKKDSPLQPSGLLGPVKLLTLQKVPVK
jgi:hypothetical protein